MCRRVGLVLLLDRVHWVVVVEEHLQLHVGGLSAGELFQLCPVGRHVLWIHLGETGDRDKQELVLALVPERRLLSQTLEYDCHWRRVAWLEDPAIRAHAVEFWRSGLHLEGHQRFGVISDMHHLRLLGAFERSCSICDMSRRPMLVFASYTWAV